jgi:hypothetical protein
VVPLPAPNSPPKKKQILSSTATSETGEERRQGCALQAQSEDCCHAFLPRKIMTFATNRSAVRGVWKKPMHVGCLRWESHREMVAHPFLTTTAQACEISQLTPLWGQFLTYYPRPVRAPPWLRNCVRNRTKILHHLFGLIICPNYWGSKVCPNY